MNKKIEFYMICKNEQEMISRALESIKDADSLVVVDTGSTDNTVEIAKKYTDKIYHFPWIDDFSAAKNFAASKCKVGDFICSMDADLILEEGGIAKIKKAINEAKDDVLNVLLVSLSTKEHHLRAKIYRNNGKIFYKGLAHENLNKEAKNEEPVVIIYYDYSPNHFKDPDRYIRILTKSIEQEPKVPRWKFYLAREYYYKKDYYKAIGLFQKYIYDSKFLAEIVEAQIMLALCYWNTYQGNLARETCTKALINNPDHKSVLKLMAKFYEEPHRSKWLHIMNNAKQTDVLFRVKDEKTGS